jgi:PAS domain S-box-containing protein
MPNQDTSLTIELKKLPSIYIWLTVAATCIPYFLNNLGISFDSTAMPDKGALIHTILEWSAVMLAFTCCALAFTNYAIKKDPVSPVLGVALLSAGMIDAFHILVADGLISSNTNGDFAPFTWALCRMFSALICLVGIGILLLKSNAKKQIDHQLIINISLLFFLAAILSMAYSFSADELPQTQYANQFITRPWDLLPLILFVLSFFAYQAYFERNPSPFMYSMLLSIIPAIATQVHMVLGSSQLFDNHFMIAHFLKIVSYALPVIGLTWSYISTHREKEFLNHKVASLSTALYSGAMILETDDKGIITAANDSLVIHSGYLADELIGKSLLSICKGKTTLSFDDEFKKYIQIKKLWTGELNYLRQDGSSYWVLTTIIPKYSFSNDLIGYTCIEFDITDKKKYEAELIQARDVAERAEIVKSEFLANMSHEIRTPMNGVLGMLQLLGLTELSERQKELLATTKSCGDSLMRILNDILDISKLDSGKLSLEKIDFNLNKCINEAIYLTSHIASIKHIDIIYKPSFDTETYYIGDVTRLRQILLNFLSNAVKFTDQGCINIDVQRNIISNDEHELTINVKDTGIGISSENQKKLFRQFTQADSTTTREYGGTGLGLSICARLVRLMNGKVFFESEFKKGSTFGFVVSLKVGSKENQPDSEVTSSVNRIKQESNKKHLNILLVEDNIVNQQIFDAMLNSIGYNCDIANDGLEGIEAYEKALASGRKPAYDIIFMDMQMPRMDGVEAAKTLAHKYPENLPPIIAVTANAFDEDKQKCYEAGMIDFIAKPINIKHVLSIIEQHIKRSSTHE